MKLIFVALACGILLSLVTGFVENKTKIAIPENKYYGYPFDWRMTSLNGPTEYSLINLAVDTIFWIVATFLAFFILMRFLFPKLDIRINYKAFFLPLILIIPLGLVMDFVHELGHTIWGTAVGGRLTYMQIAYFVIYPQLTAATQFQLGLANIEGLTFGSFAYGLMLLGGSMTTNIAAWLFGIILLKTSFGNKTQVAIKVLGLFGILDLPFYVLFPQVGFGHWIFFGGESGPEPLNGTRMMGIPNSTFYSAIIFSTLGLIVLYVKSIREKLSYAIERTK